MSQIGAPFAFVHRYRAAMVSRLVGDLGRDPTRAEALRRYRHGFLHMRVVRAYARGLRARHARRALL